MNKLLTILLLIATLFSYGQSEHLTDPQIDSIFSVSQKYKSHFWRDGGDLQKDRDFKLYLAFAELENLSESIEFAWFGQAATQQRKDGIYSYATKLYEIYNGNDATQNTESSQPYVSGNIAPNEVEALKSPIGDTRKIEHTEISFADTDEFTFTFNLNSTQRPLNNFLNGKNGVGGIRINSVSGGGKVELLNDAISAFSPTGDPFLEYFGKNTTLTITYASSVLSFYINGNLVGTDSFAGSFSTNLLLAGRSVSDGTRVGAYIIRSEALTPSQVAAEHALLREIYPEIPSVKIGEQEWATSNCEMVATPEGNVIKNVTDNTEWSNATVVYDSVYAATTGTATEKEYAALKEASYWCYYNNSSEIGAVYGKLYNWYAAKLLDLDMASSNYGWRVPTETDFNTLATTLGGTSVAGGKMKVPGTDYWNSPNTGATNESGFTALGSGYRSQDGIFALIKLYASYAVIDNLIYTAKYNTANFSSATLGFLATRGVAIRLIKD